MLLTQANTSNNMDTVKARVGQGAGNKTGITGLDISIIGPRDTCLC